MNRIEYCPVCLNKKKYKINKIKKTYEIDGIDVVYFEKDAICSICGEELYIDKLMKKNQVKFEKAYNKTFFQIEKNYVKK